MLPIGDLLKQVRRPVNVESDTHYREIGIRSHGKGIFHKPETTGKQIGEKRVFWVEPDCLVFNIVFAWEQAVAMTSKAEVGMIASHRFPMYCSRNGKLLPEYAWRYFSTLRGKYDLNIASPGGAGRNKTLGQEEFKRLKIPIPPIEYQREVVEVLSTTDRAIAGMEQLIATKRTLKKGLAQQLLTGQHRLPGCYMPWLLVALGDMGQVVSGGTPDTTRSDFWDGEHPWCTPTDVTKCSTYIHETDRRITEQGLAASSAALLPKNSLVVCTRATIGECALTGVQLATNQGFKSIVFSKSYEPLFVFHSLTLHKHKLLRLANGSTFLEVSKRDFCRVELPMPQREEQIRIAAVLDAADRGIAVLEKKLAVQRKLKKGLMQKLLTGTMPTKETA